MHKVLNTSIYFVLHMHMHMVTMGTVCFLNI